MKTLNIIIALACALFGGACKAITLEAGETKTVRTTAYTHTEADHKKYGRKTAIGTTLKYGKEVRSAAADWSFFPLGTKFKIVGEPHVYVVEDYGGALVGTETIDIYKPSKTTMRKWGVKHVEIEVVEWGCPHESMAILKHRCGYRHCRAMYNNLLASHG